MSDNEPLPEGTFTVTIRFEPSEGWYSVVMLDHPGVISQGKTRYSALRNLVDAWKGMDESDAEDEEAARWAQNYERRKAAGELTEDERDAIPFDQAMRELDDEATP